MKTEQIAVVVSLVLALSAWFFFDLGSYLQFETLQQRIGDLRQWYENNPLLAGLIYFAAYVTITALSVPGAAVMTLAGGALFGSGTGFYWCLLPAVSALRWPSWFHVLCSEIGSKSALGVTLVP